MQASLINLCEGEQRKSHDGLLTWNKVNCLLETFFDAAIEDAKKLDEYFAQHKKPIGPLHGLPVSLKDQFHVRGVETSMGYVGTKPRATCDIRLHSTKARKGGLVLLKADVAQGMRRSSRVRWSRSCETWERSSSVRPVYPIL